LIDGAIFYIYCIIVNNQTKMVDFFFLSAVYLCKRTMQNKARLELADYEAVSTEDFPVEKGIK
jgi:hypothetical protein